MAPEPFKANENILNDDILAQIFMLNTEVDFDNPHIPSRTLRYTSQVSKTWRNLTLALPSLWASSLNFADSTRWIQTVLERAGDAPLNITYPPLSNDLLCDEKILSAWRHLEYDHILSLAYENSPHSRGSSHIDKLYMALSLFSRSRRFRLKLDVSDAWHARRKAISLTAPHLEELALLIGSGGPQFSSLLQRLNAGTPFVAIPPPDESNTIFGVGIPHNPNLRLLQLSRYEFKSQSPMIELQTLRTLIIDRIDEKSSLTINEWGRILACSPQLEVLHLRDRCFKDPDYYTTMTETGTLISLSKLRSIILEGFLGDVSVVLLRIQFPQSCAVDLRLIGEPNNAPLLLVDRLFVFLQQRIQDLVAQRKIVDLSLFLKHYPGLGWKIWNNIHSGDERTLSVAWLPPYPSEDLNTLPIFPSLKLILDIISSDLTSLYLDTTKIMEDEPPYVSGLLPLRGMENVKTLSIPSTGTLKYIWQLFTDDHTANRAHPLLPALQLIILGSLYITEKAKNRFYSIFEMRSQIGAPIPKCRVQECNGRYLKVLIDDLRALGVHVEWDGKYRTSDLTKPDVTSTLAHLEIQTEWNGVLKDDIDDGYDSDDLFESDFAEEDEDEDSDDDDDENNNNNQDDNEEGNQDDNEEGHEDDGEDGHEDGKDEPVAIQWVCRDGWEE